MPATPTRPVQVFSQDESRFGLLTIRRRRLTACGVQPVGRVQPVFEWFYVYGAVEPTTGDRFFLELPYLDAETFRSEEHTSELQSRQYLVCRLLLEKKNN